MQFSAMTMNMLFPTALPGPSSMKNGFGSRISSGLPFVLTYVVAMLEPTLAGVEARIRQCRVADSIGEPPPHAVVADEEREVAVSGLEVLRRHQRRVRGVRGAREFGHESVAGRDGR